MDTKLGHALQKAGTLYCTGVVLSRSVAFSITLHIIHQATLTSSLFTYWSEVNLTLQRKGSQNGAGVVIELRPSVPSVALYVMVNSCFNVSLEKPESF